MFLPMSAFEPVPVEAAAVAMASWPRAPLEQPRDDGRRAEEDVAAGASPGQEAAVREPDLEERRTVDPAFPATEAREPNPQPVIPLASGSNVPIPVAAASSPPIPIAAHVAPPPAAAVPVRSVIPEPERSRVMPVPERSVPVAGASSAPTRTPAEERAAYAAGVRARLQARRNYPASARALGWEGKAIVTLEVQADGSAARVALERGSGFPVLDRAALDLVRSSVPLPPPPHGAMTITIPIVYALARPGAS